MSEYIAPKTCDCCGSEEIYIKVIYSNATIQAFCQNCGNSKTLPKIENLKRRTNTTLSNMARQAKKFHPYCTICGSKENLEAHHIIPVKYEPQYRFTPTNLLILCKRCHYLVHRNETDADRGEDD